MVVFLAGFAALFVLLLVVPNYFLALGAVLVGALVLEYLDRVRPREALRRLGFGRPTVRALVWALTAALLVQLVYPVYGWMTGNGPPELREGWFWLLLGILAYHGVAEELVWRGYAYRRLREGRTFWRAVLLTMPLIAATHIPIVIDNGPLVGVAALVVAAVTSIPFAHLFEMGHNTIWAPAILHAGIDSFKLVQVDGPVFSLLLAGASVVVPLVVLIGRREPATSA